MSPTTCKVITWGDSVRGGDSTLVQEQLINVQQIQAAAGNKHPNRFPGISRVVWSDIMWRPRFSTFKGMFNKKGSVDVNFGDFVVRCELNNLMDALLLVTMTSGSAKILCYKTWCFSDQQAWSILFEQILSQSSQTSLTWRWIPTAVGRETWSYWDVAGT